MRSGIVILLCDTTREGAGDGVQKKWRKGGDAGTPRVIIQRRELSIHTHTRTAVKIFLNTRVMIGGISRVKMMSLGKRFLYLESQTL